MMCKLFFSIKNKPTVVCKSASSLDALNKDAYVFNFDLNIYIHLILIQDEPELGEVFNMWYLDAVKMRCLIKLQWEQKLSIVARDKELRCMIGMYRYLLLGRSWEFFSLQLEETKTNFRLKCRIIFQIRTQKLYYSFCSCQGS